MRISDWSSDVCSSDLLSLDEITATAMQLVFAGAGTSSNGLANTIYLLLRNPAQLEALRADPALVQPAIHEGVRCDSPVFFTFRIPKVDVTIQGITIPAGEQNGRQSGRERGCR